ncbi:TPA: MobA/MobL family protein [Escherichia coli]|nr:MobA/MobL family protein [Escherichia coli]
MPAWAQDNPQMFWTAADAYERKNGTAYREMEIALPRELDSGQREALVRDWVTQEIGDKHPYQWAIHSPTAADGAEQPHVHLMFSERRCDGIERDPEQYFKRYNSKAPENGGARKGYGEHAGETRTLDQRRDELKALRERWQERCNTHLERADQKARIDMRSYQAQGVDLEPERKMLPSEWRDAQTRGQVLDFRAAKEELTASRREAEAVVRQEAQKQASGDDLKARQQKLIEENRARIDRMTPRDIREIDAELRGAVMKDNRHRGYLTKMAAPAVNAHPAVVATQGYAERTQGQADAAQAKINEARERERLAKEQTERHQRQLKEAQEAASEWAGKHGVRHWMHSKGIRRDAGYSALEKRLHDEQQQLKDARQQLQERQQATEEAERAAVKPLQEAREAREQANEVRSRVMKEERDKISNSPVFQQFRRDVSERHRALEQRERDQEAQRERDYARLENELKHRRENAPQQQRSRSYGPKM